jgi:hypothetical protein
MSLLPLLRVSAFLIGLVILGEALALLVGMHILSEHGNPWISFQNDFLLGVDIVTGSALMYLAMVNGRIDQSNLAYFAVTLAFLAHAYREWEYLIKSPTRFCINSPLFMFNNVKLIGLVVLILGTAVLKFIRF